MVFKNGFFGMDLTKLYHDFRTKHSSNLNCLLSFIRSHISCLVRWVIAMAAAVTLSISMGSEEANPGVHPGVNPAGGVTDELGEITDDPELVKELGVDALEASEVAEWATVGTLVDSGRVADIHGWASRSLRLGLSLGRIFKHRRIMSWHSPVSRVRNRTSALQIASSFS